MIKFGANDVETLGVVRSVIEQWMEDMLEKIEPPPPTPPPPKEEEKKTPEVSVLDAAIRSIMPESEDDLSLTKPHLRDDVSLTKPLLPPVKPGSTTHDAVQATIAGHTYTADTCWQAGIDALLAGASMKGAVSDLPPAQLFQTPEHEQQGAKSENDKKRTSGSESNDDNANQAPVIG